MEFIQMNIENVVFFNAAARGDVFIGRGFVKHAIEHILIPNNIKYSYVTCWDHYFTKDLSLEHYRWNHLDGYDKEQHFIDPQAKWFIKNKTLYFNTWYCADNKKYHNKYGCTLKTISCIFNDFYNMFGFPIDENLMNYLPKINYDVYDTQNVKNHFKNKQNKNIFISTSHPRSDQATTESLVSLIEILSNKYNNINFYITDPVFKSKNVFYTGDIIRNDVFTLITHDELSKDRHPQVVHPGINENGIYINKPDLIESSYFSTFCDVIIGKSTGTYTHSLVEENIKNKKTKFVGICSLSLASAGLHQNISDKFYSVTNSIEYDLTKNINLISSVVDGIL
jgi:hypothetical protein